MLRACHDLLRPGGRLGFLTIHVAPGLDADDRRRAVAAGPPAVDSEGDHDQLLVDAGFIDVAARDRSDDYRTTQLAWIDQTAMHEAHLRELMGDGPYEERREERRRALAAIEAGLLRRTLFLGRRP